MRCHCTHSRRRNSARRVAQRAVEQMQEQLRGAKGEVSDLTGEQQAAVERAEEGESGLAGIKASMEEGEQGLGDREVEVDEREAQLDERCVG